MFTGLIEDLGTLLEIRRGGSIASVTVATSLPMHELALGESIAVNGTCLTVTSFGGGRFSADVSPETLEKTSLGTLHHGTRVNLERALRLSDRLGGHLMSGHIDGVARLIERTRQGNSWFLAFRFEASLTRFMVPKGSVAIDGISLTVNEVFDESLSVMIIPHTLERTTLASLQVGGQVNIETDLIGKYVARLLGGGDRSTSGVTLDLLAKSGFL
jgi:riboflavin synthase